MKKTKKIPKTLTVGKKTYRLYRAEEVFPPRSKWNKEYREAYEAEMARLALIKEIREARQKKKLTQKAVADRAGMPQSVIARIESGNHGLSFSTLHKVASALGKRIALV